MAGCVHERRLRWRRAQTHRITGAGLDSIQGAARTVPARGCIIGLHLQPVGAILLLIRAALGLIGLAAFGFYYLQTATMMVLAIFRRKGAYLAAPFFAVYTMMTLTESIAVVYNDFRWVLLVAFSTKLALTDHPEERDARR